MERQCDDVAILEQTLQTMAADIDHVFIDFDGVVMDSEPLQCMAYARVLHDYGIDFGNDMFIRYIGNTEEVILDRLQVDFSIDFDKSEFSSRRAALLDSFMSQVTEPHWFIRPVLDWCDSHRLPVAIVSAGHAPRIRGALDRLGIAHQVADVITVPEQPSGTTKPELIVRLANDNANSHLLIEDSPSMISFGRSIGMKTIAVRHDYNVGTDLLADVVIDVRRSRN